MLNPFPIRLVLPGYGKVVKGEGGENSLPGGREIASMKLASLVVAACGRTVLGLEDGGELKSGPESGIPQGYLGLWACWLASQQVPLLTGAIPTELSALFQ